METIYTLKSKVDDRTEEVKNEPTALSTTESTSERPAQDDNVLMDFTTMFKKGPSKGFVKKPSDKQQENKPAAANWLLEIPTKLTITLDDLKERKVFDVRRWNCLTRAMTENQSGVAAVASCWNYLYSRAGVGKMEPLSAKTATDIL